MKTWIDRHRKELELGLVLARLVLSLASLKQWATSHSKTVTTGFLLLVLAVSLASGLVLHSRASTCAVWYQCPISQYYGQNQEHGVDLLTHGLPITALLSGVVTFDAFECWSGECVQDITWKLDAPALARGEPYAYVQIANSRTAVGRHLWVGSLLGYSGTFIEFGLTPDREYGVSGWHWGINPLFLL